jgi:putative endonuclease
MSINTVTGKLGSEGEDLAVHYLQGKGFRILKRNYKTPIGEADIVAASEGIVVFVEVKTRSSARFGEPFEAVNTRKREKLKKIALYYQMHEDNKAAIRFDVVSIKSKDSGFLIEHIEEAF